MKNNNQLDNNQLDNNQLDNNQKKFLYTIFFSWIFIILWLVIGFIAFITSCVCFFRQGSTIDKIIGLILALFFGPFYFLFYGLNKDYCK